MKRLILLVSLLFLAPSVFANSWTDPEWEEMIRDSKLIGLFEVIEGGEHEALVQPISLIKGTQSEQLELANLNNAHWSEDFMAERALRTGQKVYLFIHVWDDAYTDPTPTTGMMPLNPDNTINYSLFSPSGSWDEPAHPAGDFEFFISNIVHFQETGIPDEKLIRELGREIDAGLTNIETNGLSDRLVQYRLWGGRDWLEGLKRTPDHPQPEVRYQAALLLGEILPDDNAEGILIQLLDDPTPIVQGQAVEQLMKIENKEKALALLTSKLPTAAAGSAGPGNIMDPVMNTYNGGQLEIIEQIRKHKYSPAEDELLLLMEQTRNEYVFNATFRALKSIGQTNVTTAVLKQLQAADENTLFSTLQIADKVDYTSPEIQRELGKLIGTLPRDSMSTVLAFELLTESNTNAVFKWFEPYFKQSCPNFRDDDVCAAMIDMVTISSPPEMHNLIERVLFYLTGMDSWFVEYPFLVDLKNNLESNLCDRVLATSVIEEQYAPEARAIVFIENVDELISNQTNTPTYTYHIDITVTSPDPQNDDFYEKVKNHDNANFIVEWLTVNPIDVWQYEISKKSGIPVGQIGIAYQLTERYRRIQDTDSRTDGLSDLDLARAYCRYAKRMESDKYNRLIQLYFESGRTGRWVKGTLKTHLQTVGILEPDPPQPKASWMDDIIPVY